MYRERGADTWLPFSSSYSVIEHQETYNTTFAQKTFTVSKKAKGFMVAWGAQTQNAVNTTSTAVGLNGGAVTPVLSCNPFPNNSQLNMQVMFFDEPLEIGDEITVMYQLAQSFNYSSAIVAY